MTFSEKLIYCRQLYGYTQQQLADVMKVTRRHINELENEKACPSMEDKVKLSTIFNFELDDFEHIWPQLQNDRLFLGFHRRVISLITQFTGDETLIRKWVSDFILELIRDPVVQGTTVISDFENYFVSSKTLGVPSPTHASFVHIKSLLCSSMEGGSEVAAVLLICFLSFNLFFVDKDGKYLLSEQETLEQPQDISNPIILKILMSNEDFKVNFLNINLDAFLIAVKKLKESSQKKMRDTGELLSIYVYLIQLRYLYQVHSEVYLPIASHMINLCSLSGNEIAEKVFLPLIKGILSIEDSALPDESLDEESNQ